MQINWCLKGITEDKPSFTDVQAASVLTETGILSNWMLANRGASSWQANVDAQNALNASALDDHVNNYAKVRATTPYISLSSGCYEFASRTSPPNRYEALRTAIQFATKRGRQSGYVFRCWVVTGLKPAPELPGLAEETRDLNLFSGLYRYHYQGEVTAKLVVARRQVAWVMKYGADMKPLAASWSTTSRMWLDNPDFVDPTNVSNIIEVV